MPSVARFNVDMDDGACGFPPTVAETCSPDVSLNGQFALRQGDSFYPHPHPRVIVSGSSTVSANGRQIARQGDPLSCGAHIATGSSNVGCG
jgi:uncharacterized Zn-binding protein involved in type VI secretion